jgi:hypothetical protein
MIVASQLPRNSDFGCSGLPLRESFILIKGFSPEVPLWPF